MTTHTQDELQRWCELAGLEAKPQISNIFHGAPWWWVQDWKRAVPEQLFIPYVAELLVGKVRVLESDDRCIGDHHSNALRGEVDSLSSEICMLATASQRCRAAEKVLTT